MPITSVDRSLPPPRGTAARHLRQAQPQAPHTPAPAPLPASAPPSAQQSISTFPPPASFHFLSSFLFILTLICRERPRRLGQAAGASCIAQRGEVSTLGGFGHLQIVFFDGTQTCFSSVSCRFLMRGRARAWRRRQSIVRRESMLCESIT